MISWVGASSNFLYSFVFFVNEIDFDYRGLGEDIFHYCYNLCNTIAIILDHRGFFSLFDSLSMALTAFTHTHRQSHLTRETNFIQRKNKNRRVFEIVHAGSAICLWYLKEMQLKLTFPRSIVWTTRTQIQQRWNWMRKTMNEIEQTMKWFSFTKTSHCSRCSWTKE